jgi:DNA-binding LacI/PurR family transcriptional regulator
MADIAAEVGVSRPLVSLVVRGAPGPSEATRKRILAAAAEMGYHPDLSARMLRGTTTHQLGVLFTLNDAFQVEVVENIYIAAEEIGYNIVIGPLTATRSQETVLNELMGYRSEALIIVAPTVDLTPLAILSERVPIVELGRQAKPDKFEVVRSNDANGVRQGIDHLVSLGHQAIVHVDGANGPGAAERRAGYKTAMRRHRLADFIQVISGDYSEAAGVAAAHVLMAKPPLPTAVITGNDHCAKGLLDAFSAAGVKVPDDVSVVGFDDSQYARLVPHGLTTIRQDTPGLAKAAVGAIAERVDGHRGAAKRIVLPPTLVVRGSTGAPRTVR